MSRITQKKKRIKQGIKIRTRIERRNPDDSLAMLAAGLDEAQWVFLPQHQKQLYRLRATQAMSIFNEQPDGQ